MTPEPSKPADPGDAEAEQPRCPYCGARDSRSVSDFGLSLMTRLRRCLGCGADFEVVRWK